MARFLIVFGSAYGHTERIARRIARGVESEGHHAVCVRGDGVSTGVWQEGHDAVVVAGSVRVGRYDAYIKRFIRDHVAQLNATPSAFVSVCGAAGDPSPAGQRHAEGYVTRLLRETGWRPRVTRSFAGELAFTRYGVVVRWVMKMISRRIGGPTDTSRDYDFTNWEDVDRFAKELSANLVPQPV